MIRKIYIKNYAIIDEINIDLKSGLTVITGETGSGKSILLEALGVCLGSKVNKEMVRNNEKRAVVEVKFEDRNIRRLVFSEGRSKAYQNDEPISLSGLKKNNYALIDFHGQHDQQLILNKKSHIDYLDQYCQHQKKVDELMESYNDLVNLKNKLKILLNSKKEKTDRLSLLKFQAKEIDEVNPTLVEETFIKQQYKKLSNIQKIKEILQSSKYLLFDDNSGIEQNLVQVQKDIDGISEYDANLLKISELLKEVTIQLGEIDSEIASQLNHSDFDREEFDILSDRINAFEVLKRKYGGSIDSVLEFRQNIGEELSNIENFDKTESLLKSEILKKEDFFSKGSIEIHNQRVKKAKKLSILIEQIMSDLNMPNSKFNVKIDLQENINGFVNFNNELYQENTKGIDSVEFFLSANPGEPLKPLSYVASGGEISRIMLAIKTVFQSLDPVATLVFDEIDTGISGATAKKVLNHLLDLSKSKQVICITHLSQIAKHADNHLHIEKYVRNDKTHVNAKYLKGDERSKIINSLFYGD